MSKVTDHVAASTVERVTLTQREIDLLLDRAERSRGMLGDLAFSLIKWIIASLLAINGGGAISILNVSSLPKSYFLLAEALFIVGVLSALLCAFLALYVLIGMLPDQAAIITLTPGAHKKSEIIRIFEGKPVKTGFRDPLLIAGWMSALLFVAGALTVGFSTSDHDASATPAAMTAKTSQKR